MEILGSIRKIYFKQFIEFRKLCNANKQTRNKSKALELSHRIHGPSPAPDSVPIFILHGYLGSKKNWENICNKITVSTNKSVIAVDARNHGDSPSSNSLSYFDQAADISKLITKFAIKKCIIIGHSMGGRTGMVMALTKPTSVATLIVVDSSPVSTSSMITDLFPRVMDIMMTVDFTGLYLNEATKAAKSKILENELFQNEVDMQFLLANIGKLPDKSIGWKYNLGILKKTFNTIATFPNMNGKTYNGPTLFVGGKLSYSIPTDDLGGIRRLFPAAQLLYIDGVGHNVHTEDPSTFLEIVMQFLAQNAMIKTSM